MCKESHGVGQIAQRESKQDKQNLFSLFILVYYCFLAFEYQNNVFHDVNPVEHYTCSLFSLQTWQKQNTIFIC